MYKIGLLIHSIVPEQAAVIYNSCMIHNMKQLDVSFMLKPKKKSKNPIWHILDSNRATQPLKIVRTFAEFSYFCAGSPR